MLLLVSYVEFTDAFVSLTVNCFIVLWSRWVDLRLCGYETL